MWTARFRLAVGVVGLSIVLGACGSDLGGGDATSTTVTRPLAPDSLPVDESSTVPASTTSMASTTSTPVLGNESSSQLPSQSEDAAHRDGVIPELARLPFDTRVESMAEVTAEEGTWVLSRASRELVDLSMPDGCGFGDLTGTYPTEVICTVEYGEILLVDDKQQVTRAYPMPGAIPSWIYLTPTAVYAGRIGDGGLPDSTLVRIDRTTLQATVMLVPAEFDGGTEWPPSWHIATPEQRDRYHTLVGFSPDMTGTPVTSWIGDVVVNLEGIDQLMPETTQ